MKNDPLIHKIAQMLHIPKHTLLYWEKEGLLHFERDPVNRYRKATLSTIFEIDQVVHCRNMSLPIAQIRQLPQMSLSQQAELLEKAGCRLEEKIQALEQSRAYTQAHLENISEVQRLSLTPYLDETPAFSRVVAYSSQDHWNIGNTQPDLFVLVISPQSPDLFAEGFIDDDREKECLWECSANTGIWKTFILRVRLEAGQKKNNDLPNHLDRLRAMGYESKLVLARYMAEATEEGGYFLYYKAWAQIKSK